MDQQVAITAWPRTHESDSVARPRPVIFLCLFLHRPFTNLR